ncbi:hypothetical protein ACEWY4_013737 [Coilia grayii]|uniref:Ig-like domain-containing protein n=1 Tax=Coilia grayii TaxID=363190 RepID=A0ABD1JX82_9TELE
MRIIWIFFCWMIRISAGCDLHDKTSIIVTKYSGEDVLLPCSCAELQTKPVNLRWVKSPGASHLEIYPKTGETFKGRIQISNKDSPGSLSLLISHLTKNDEGAYRCEGNGAHSYRDITLRVTDPLSPTMTSLTTTPEKQNSVTSVSKEKESETKPPSYIFILVAVLLMLLLGGATFLYFRHKGLKRKSGQMQDKDQKDDVTYTIVVHGRNPKVAQVRLNTDDRTEYASIRTT